MRKCRKMISVIMLMVMLVSLLPSGALAAEAPTGATNEVAAVEEPTEVEPATGETEETLPAETKTDGTENEGDNETTITEGTSEGASVSDGTDATEVSAAGETSAEVAEEVEPAEASAAGETSVEVAPAVEPVEKEAKAAGEPLRLVNYLDGDNHKPPIVVEHKKPNEDESAWVVYESDYELIPKQMVNADDVKITVYFKFPKSDDPTKPLLYNPDTDEVLDVIYDLPDAVYIENEIETSVKNSAGATVGSLKITTDGRVTIKFNKDYVKDGKAIEGSFYFWSLIDGEYVPPKEGFFSFPGVGEPIRVYIDEITTSNIKITKANSGLKFENGAYKTTYTLKVTTEKGTVAPITIEDKVSNTNSGVYSYTYTDPVVEFKAAGSTTSSVVPASVSRDGNNWTITGLPKINVGDEYVIKYDATIKQETKEFTAATHSQNKGTQIYNTATAKSGDASAQAKQNVLTVYQELKKSYKAVDANRKIYDWTIEINKNKHDITGYTYKDKMSEGMELISKVTIQSASGAKDELTLDKNEFSYTFTKEKWSAADLKNTFTITYRTSHPTATKDVYNDGILIGAGLTYKDQGKIVVGPNPAMKVGKYTNKDAVYDDHTRYTLSMQWKLGEIILPTSIKAGETFTYTDELGKLYQGVDANGNPVVYNSEAVDWVPVEGIKHYTYCKSIAAMLHHNIWITTTEGYYTYNTYAENEGHSYFTETGEGGTFFETDAVSFKITGYDADGNGYDIVEYQNDTTIEIVKFDVEIIAHKDLAVTNATMNAGGNGVYTSWVRYGEENNLIVNGGPITKITNRIYEVGHKDTWTAETSHGWRLGADMDKSAVIEQEGNEAFIKYTVNVHYDLLNYGVPVTLTDQRSFDSSKYSGGVGQYVDGSASIKVYEQWEDTAPNTWITQQANNRCFEVDSSQDKDGKLLFKFDFTKKNWSTYVRRIEITYKVKVIGEPGVDGDNYWDDGRNNYKVYKNEVSDEEGRTVEAETPVRRDSRIVDKTGTQLVDGTEYTKAVEFDIKINPEKLDLDKTNNKITLTDTLTDESDVASFDYSSLTLKDGDTGAVIGQDAWESNFDPETKTLTVVVDDQKSYILTYRYKLNKDKIVEGYTVINNEAVVNGNWRDGGKVPVHAIKVDIEVDKREISITKTGDSTHIKLGGAEFELEKYNSDNQSWVYVDKYVTGEENGTIVLAGTEMDSDVLYRLTETKAPEGYSNKDLNGKDITYYLVVMDKDENEEEARQKVVCDPEVDSSEIHFFAHAGGTDEIKNKKVGSLSVSKTVKNGSTSDKNKAFNFTVTLSDKSITGKFGDMTFDKGVANFTLKDGETKTADRIPVGTTYTVVETGSNGYTVNKSGDTGTISTTKSEAKFTNTPDTTSVSVLKVWDDFDDEAHKRPKSITVQLLADNEVVKDSQVTLDGTVDDIEKTAWQYTWENLPKNKDGKQIVYEVGEVSLPDGYTKTVSGNATTGYTITNSYMPKTEATVKKVWDDNNNNDGKRPETLKVTLSKKVGETITSLQDVILPIGDKWEKTIENLPKYEKGVEIKYIWTEDENSLPEGYTLTGNKTEGTITTLTNYRPGDKKIATVKKVWSDNNNNDRIRPDKLVVTLNKTVDGKTTKVKDVTLEPANGVWEYTETGLPAKENGKDITYTWTEEDLRSKGYELIGNSTEGVITTLTNWHPDDNFTAIIQKVWDDDNDHDGKRPEELTVTLNKKVRGVTSTVGEFTLGAPDWKAAFANLPKKDDGDLIEYFWTEEDLKSKGYELTSNTTEETVEGRVTTLTNKHTPETINVYVEKEWDDKNDQDGVRPAKIIVKLIDRDDPEEKAIQSTELSEAKGWSYTFTNLPKYKKTAAGSVEITYDVTEIVEGTDSLDGYNLTKTTIPADTIPADKLPEGVEGVGFAYHLKNTYSPEKRNISVLKVWDDANNMDKRQPVEITVQLYADGASFGDPVTLKKSEGWTYTWEGLDKNRDEGVEIQYTVDEVEVPDGYEKVSIKGGMTTGYIITNKHDKRPVSISKVDITNSKEVAGATLQILDNGKVVTAKDEEGNDFECTWTSTTEPKVIYGLTPGTVYTLHEEVQPDGYTIAADTTFTVDANGVVTSSGTVTNNVVLVEDAPTKVNVRKVDIANDKELPGATLQIIDSKGVVFKEWTSTEEDYVVTNLIAGEEYTLVETVAPLGFAVTSKTTFTVDNNNKVTSTGATTTLEDGTPVLLVKDTMTVVKISKTDITGDKELKGATLQILDESENVVTVKDHDGNDVKCEWVSTDKPHVVEGLEINKTYTLREKTAPDGFTITADATFSIDENNRITTEIPRNSAGVLLVKDKPTKVKVSKVDITGEKELQGATLQILDSEGKVVEIKDNDGNVVETCEWVSAKEPKDIVGLKTGVVYTLHETVAPDGYTIANDFQFTIAADGTVTCTGKTATAEDGTTVLLVEDAPTKVYISKTDITNGEELPGATLQILDEEENVIVIKDNDGNPVETLEWVSGEEPKYIEGLPTGVNYILRETISPDGYTIASDTKFTIDEKGVVTSDGTTSTAEDGTTVLVVEDDLTTVQISKVDAQSDKELEGAKLQIIDEENNIVEEWISTKEVHVVRGLVANKKYILREQVAPLGYTLTTDTTFSIDMHNVVTSTGPVNKDGVILVKDTMTEVEILKVDSKTGKGLAGAKLQVLDDNGAVCDEWKSTKDAHKIRGLYTGVKYTLHEVEAPKGYDKAKDITFTIDTAGKVSSDALDNGKIVMKDTPTPKKNKTGDEANGSLWALLLMMASGALGGTVWFKRRRRA